MSEIHAVIGAQFGDECKGSFTQYLCDGKDNNLIIRFNGGHQAGHTVLNKSNNKRHIFSSFGSGTLLGNTTYWSKYCTVYPIGIFNEYRTLVEEHNIKKINILFDYLCPLTTPYDVISNVISNDKSKHGSVGVGFGETIKRHENNYKLYYMDIFNSSVLNAKLSNIRKYYEDLGIEFKEDIDKKMKLWFDCIEYLIEEKIFTKARINDSLNLNKTYKNISKIYSKIIFEGAQGILLDMDYGFFPNVTRSNTTTKNIIQIMNDLSIDSRLRVHYITRCYQTRHGNGFMTNEDIQPNLINTENEINSDTSYQGKFRKSILDLDLLKHAIECDHNELQKCNNYTNEIVISCLDQLLDNNIQYTLKGEFYTKTQKEFFEILRKELCMYKLSYSLKEGDFSDFSSQEVGRNPSMESYISSSRKVSDVELDYLFS
jgi:adenylosuccinate synthase